MLSTVRGLPAHPPCSQVGQEEAGQLARPAAAPPGEAQLAALALGGLLVHPLWVQDAAQHLHALHELGPGAVQVGGVAHEDLCGHGGSMTGSVSGQECRERERERAWSQQTVTV